MKQFKNIDELVIFMAEKCQEEESVSVIANRKLSIDILKTALSADDVVLDFAELDYKDDYEKEYTLDMTESENDGNFHVSICKAYSYPADIYLGGYDYVLYHEDVPSKAMKDINNNKLYEPDGCDWFCIGEDIDMESETPQPDDAHDHKPEDTVKEEKRDKKAEEQSPAHASSAKYYVNGREVGKDEYDAVASEYDRIREEYCRNITDMLLKYCHWMDGVNDWMLL